MIDFLEIDTRRDKDLRDYQIENKKKIYEFWSTGRCVMLQMPTGTGKTRLFVSIAKDLHEWAIKNGAVKILFLVHRKELIDQISSTLSKYGLAHGIIAAGFDEQHRKPFQVGSVQTLSRSNRLNSWAEKQFDIIVVDEAHHITASTYQRIIHQYPTAKLLGVTATPYRMSRVGFKTVFEDIIISDSVAKFIDAKWLSEYVYYSIKPNSKTQRDIEQLKLDRYGDYDEIYMEQTLNKDRIRAKIVDTYLQYANGKKGLVYTITKKHNLAVCAQFEENGISARAIDSDTPKCERQQIVQDFKNGKFLVLCNVNIFSEGFDCPEVEFIQLARPTRSLSMYLQQVGRGLRTHDLKEKVIFLDNVGLYNHFGLPSASRKWRYHFDGKDNATEPEAVESEPTGKERKVNWIEGEEAIDMVYSTIEAKDVKEPQVPLSILEYDEVRDFPILYLGRKNAGIMGLSSFIISYDLNDDETLCEIDDIIDTVDSSDIVNDISEQEVEKKANEKAQRFVFQLVCHSYKLVTHNGKCGVYNTFSDRLIVPCVYDWINRADVLGRSIACKEGLCGVLDIATGKEIVPTKYEDVEYISSMDFLDYYIVNDGEYCGIVAKGGETVVNVIYDSINLMTSPLSKRSEPDFLNASKDNINRIIDRNLMVISKIEPKKSDETIFNGKYYIVKYNDVYGFVTKTGRIKTPFVFKSIDPSRYDGNICIVKFGSGAGFIVSSNIELVNSEAYQELYEVAPNLFYVGDGCVNLDGERINNTKMYHIDVHNNYTIYCNSNEASAEKRWFAVNYKGVELARSFEKRKELKNYLNSIGECRPSNELIVEQPIVQKVFKSEIVLSDEYLTNVAVGDMVYHDKFKSGKVVGVEYTNDDIKATVQFAMIGEKALLLKFAKLRLIV